MPQLKPLDISEFLRDEDTIAHYLAFSAKAEDPNVFLSALADVAKARGMTDIARRTGLGRQNLYKALAPDANPSYHTLRKVMRAMDLTFSVAQLPAPTSPS